MMRSLRMTVVRAPLPLLLILYSFLGRWFAPYFDHTLAMRILAYGLLLLALIVVDTEARSPITTGHAASIIFSNLSAALALALLYFLF